MTKLILSSIVLLSFTACKERTGPQPETSKFTGEIFSSQERNTEEEKVSETVKETVQTQHEEKLFVAIPILEDNVRPLRIEEITTSPLGKTTEKKQSTPEDAIIHGLNIGDIRVSQSPERARVVLDSYSSKDTKASISGNYTFSYLPEQHRIILTLNGYKQFTALGDSKIRTFPGSNTIKKIYVTKTIDSSDFQCYIDLKQDAKVNIYDIKEPGRIVIDILVK